MAKKKANPQSDDTKPTKTQHEISTQTTDDAASEKLHSLKSLNAMLLKETVERRQQVESLTQVNEFLESELNRCKCDKVSWQSELDGVTERAVRLEIEKELVSRFVAVQVFEMAEVNRRERVAMLGKIGGLERDLTRVLEASERVRNEKESEIRTLRSRLSMLEGEISEERFILSQVCEERDDIRARLEDRIELENGLRLKLTESEKKEAVVSEKARKIKVDYDELLKEKTSIERKMDSILREKDSVESSLIESNGLVDKLRIDISQISKENMVIEADRNLLERTKSEMKCSVDELNELVNKLRKGEEQLLQKIADLEKKCDVRSEKVATLSTEIELLVKEKQEIEGTIRRVIEEKSLVAKDLNEALKMLEHQKLTIDQMVKEKMKINDAKNQGETNIMKLEKQLEKFKNTVSTLEKSIIVQTDKIKQLESEVRNQKAAFDQATKERNNALANLDGEKLEVQTLSERISKMDKDTEKLVAEKKELKSTCGVLEDDILVIKKSLAKSQKENEDSEAKLRLSEANMGRILKILKATSMICNSKPDDKIGVDQETEYGEEIKHHIKEVEAIKKAFKEKDNIVDEMKKQLELLKVCVAKADKGKSFWTMVSSATTVLAAVSLAYVARGY